MDFLQTLKAQVGGLLHIKSELYWYGGRGWDGAPGRVCLLLDAALGGDRTKVAAIKRQWKTLEKVLTDPVNGTIEWARICSRALDAESLKAQARPSRLSLAAGR